MSQGNKFKPSTLWRREKQKLGQEFGGSDGENQMGKQSDRNSDKWNHWLICPQGAVKLRGIKRGSVWGGRDRRRKRRRRRRRRGDVWRFALATPSLRGTRGGCSERVKGETRQQLEIPNNLEAVWCQGHEKTPAVTALLPRMKPS